MACSAAKDKLQFPHASGVVRVGTDRWSEHHTDIMDALCEAVKEFLSTRTRLSFRQIVDQYKRSEPRAKVGDQWAYLFYGDDNAFLLDGTKLSMSLKGLVFEPIKPRRKGCRRGSLASPLRAGLSGDVPQLHRAL